MYLFVNNKNLIFVNMLTMNPNMVFPSITDYQHDMFWANITVRAKVKLPH